MKTAAHHTRDPGTLSLCPWQHLTASGIVTGGKGQIIAGYWASPPDAFSSTEDEREQTARVLNEATKAFGTGTAWWNDVAVVPAASYPAPGLSHFPDPISRLLDEERRRLFTRQGAHFENDRAFVVCYQPPPAVVSKAADMMYRRRGRDEADTPQARALRDFGRMLDRFETQAGHVLRLRRMQGYAVTDITGRQRRRDELVNYLHYALTGSAIELDIPDAAVPLSGVIGGLDLEPGHTPLVGDQYVACVGIHGFPAESWPGILDRLTVMELPNGYRFTQRAIPRDEPEAVQDIEAKRRFWRQRTRPFFGTLLGLAGGPSNLDAHKMLEACEVSLALSKSGNVKHCWYNATVVLRHEDPATLREMAKEVERAIGQCGFAAQTETENAPDCFLATLPGNMTNNVRRPMIHTYNAADLAPSSGIWTGHAFHPNPLMPPGSPALLHARTEGGIPFRWNNATGDNGNFAFFGPPGSGKTTLLNGVCLQFLRYRRAAVRSIDYKRGMMASCLAVGGAYYELGDEPAFCPFEYVDDPDGRAQAQEWVEAAFWLQHGKPPSARQRTEVIHHMLEMLGSEPERSITNALMFCHDPEVGAALEFYTLEGPGRMFDAARNEVAETHWDAYDITNILAAGDKILLPALMCLEARFDRIADGRPILETLDEGWAAVSHPLWRPRLRQRWKVKRSKCVSMGISTQNLADMPDELLSIILENVPNTLYGANPSACQGGGGDERGPADFYRAFGLNGRQREIIRDLLKAREYYAVSPEGSRVVDFGFGPAMLTFAGLTAETEVRDLKAFIAEHGPAWPWLLLKKNGVDHAALADL